MIKYQNTYNQLNSSKVRGALEVPSKSVTKQEVMDLFEQQRKEFLDLCRWVAEKISQKKGHVTIDDVRKEVVLPLGIDGRVFGAVFNKEDWEKVGYTQTTIKSSHGRPVGVYKYRHEYKSYNRPSMGLNQLSLI